MNPLMITFLQAAIKCDIWKLNSVYNVKDLYKWQIITYLNFLLFLLFLCIYKIKPNRLVLWPIYNDAAFVMNPWGKPTEKTTPIHL